MNPTVAYDIIVKEIVFTYRPLTQLIFIATLSEFRATFWSDIYSMN